MIFDKNGNVLCMGIHSDDGVYLLRNETLLNRPDCLDGKLFSVSMFSSPRGWLDYGVSGNGHFLRIDRDSWVEHLLSDLDSLSIPVVADDFDSIRVFYDPKKKYRKEFY